MAGSLENGALAFLTFGALLTFIILFWNHTSNKGERPNQTDTIQRFLIIGVGVVALVALFAPFSLTLIATLVYFAVPVPLAVGHYLGFKKVPVQSLPSTLDKIQGQDKGKFKEAADRVLAVHPELAGQLLLDSKDYQRPIRSSPFSPPDYTQIDALIKKYGEPFEWLKKVDSIPEIRMPDDVRFEHTWILGPQGSGKTQLMQLLILRDIDRPCSIVVLDSQGDLVKNVATLEAIQDRVILIEPGEVGLNPFDMKGEKGLELLTYVFSMLSEMSPMQYTLYYHCIMLLQNVPNATLMDFMHLLRKDGYDRYKQYVSTLDEPARIFFEDEFKDPEFKKRKAELGWRLKLLLQNAAFRRMFCSPTTIDLFELLNQEKIIIIDTNKELLGSDRSALLGRFFIALILQVSQRRAGIERSKRTPTFVYVDEAWEYLSDDKVAEILDQARKMRVGMILANQRTAQIKNPNMLDALMTTSIKLVHTDNTRDTHMLAPAMKCKPEEIANLGKQDFAMFIRGVTPKMDWNFVPFLEMELEKHVPIEEVRTKMKRYAPTAILPIPDDGGEFDPSASSDKL